jgi:cytochrome c-type biogenesis protein
MELPFAFAFTAGLVATLNPCGFAMLPAYLSYFLGLEADVEVAAGSSAVRAVQVGAVVSAGFLLVFGLAGILLTLGVRAVVDALPWIAMVVGIGVVGLGVALLRGRELRVRLPRTDRAGDGRGNAGVFWFGVSYAVASLSCTLPVFLVVVAGTIPQLGLLAGISTFLVYGLGMSTLLLLVTLAVAFGKRTLLTRLRRASQHVNRAAGAILVLAGGYIVYFWATTLAGDGTTQPTAVRWMEQLSSRATNVVADAPAVVTAAALVALAIVGLLVAVAAYRTRSAAASRHAEELIARREGRGSTTTPSSTPPNPSTTSTSTRPTSTPRS